MSYVQNGDIIVMRTSAGPDPVFRVFSLPVSLSEDEYALVWYAVFENEDARREFSRRYTNVFDDSLPIVCYGGYMNAYEIGPMH